MCRCSNSHAPCGAAAVKIGVILAAAIAMAFGADGKSAWRQLVHISSVNCMTFEGPICWAGTTGGLVRFDESRNEMTVFTNSNSPLPSNAIKALALGRDSSLWIGTAAGLARIKRGGWRIYAGPGSKAPNSGVTALIPSDNGDVWVGLDYGGVYKMSDGTWTSIASKYPGFPIASVARPIRSIAHDGANRLWMAWTDYSSSSTMACLDGSKWAIDSYYALLLFATESDSSVWMAGGQATLSSPLVIRRIGPDGIHEFANTAQYRQAMAADRDGKLWIAGTDSIADFSGQVPRPIVSPVTQSPRTVIRTIAFDSASALWAGLASSYPDTGQAEIAKFNTSGWLRYKVPSGSCPLSAIAKILPDHAGNSWIYGANSVRMFDGSSWTRSSRIDSILAASSFVSMAIDKNGSAWFATARTLIRRASDGQTALFDSTTVHFLSYGTISDFAVDSFGRGLVALQEPNSSSYDYKVIAFSLSSFLLQDSITILSDSYLQRIVSSPDSSIWCAFGNRAVGRWTRQAGFRQFDTSNSVLYSYVDGLAAGPDGSVWIGGKGLVRYKAGAWTRFDTSWNVLPGLYCRPLVVDKKGNLWAAVYQTESRLAMVGIGGQFAMRAQSIPAGLACYDGERWTDYTTINSGLPSNTINCAAIDDSGTVWAGTDAGVGVFRRGVAVETFNPSGRGPNESSLTPSLSNSRSVIKFRLPRSAGVTVRVLDCQGRLQRSLFSGPCSAGEHILSLNGTAQDRNALTDKVLFVRIEANYGGSIDRRAVGLRCFLR
jgi:ligand-binding sensor domain-containing protein